MNHVNMNIYSTVCRIISVYPLCGVQCKKPISSQHQGHLQLLIQRDQRNNIIRKQQHTLNLIFHTLGWYILYFTFLSKTPPYISLIHLIWLSPCTGRRCQTKHTLSRSCIAKVRLEAQRYSSMFLAILLSVVSLRVCPDR